MKKFNSVCLALILFLFVSKQVLASSVEIVSDAGYANLRDNASLSSNIIKKINSGTVLTVVKEQGDWTQVKDGSGTTGWVFKQYTKIASSSAKVATPAAQLTITPTITVSANTAPSLFLISPSSGSVVKSSQFQVYGTGIQQSGVTVTINSVNQTDNSKVQNTVVDKDGNWMITFKNLPSGEYRLVVEGTDINNKKTQLAPVDIHVAGGNPYLDLVQRSPLITAFIALLGVVGFFFIGRIIYLTMSNKKVDELPEENDFSAEEERPTLSEEEQIQLQEELKELDERLIGLLESLNEETGKPTRKKKAKDSILIEEDISWCRARRKEILSKLLKS